MLTAVLGAALLSSAIPAAAENYFGDYYWLRFWDTTVTTSAQGFAGWGKVAWLGSGGNTGDHWLQLEWKEAVNLNGAVIQGWSQLGGSEVLGEYYIQYRYWDDTASEYKWENINTSQRLYGTGTGQSKPEYNVTFSDMPAGGVTAVRVFFPKENYTRDGGTYGPGLIKFLPYGNLASGEGLNPSNPNFNLFGTDFLTNPSDAFLGITPSVTMVGRTTNRESSTSVLFDHDIGRDGPRAGWQNATDGSETFIIDLGTELAIYGITLYGGAHSADYAYIPSSVDIYITNDPSCPAGWGQNGKEAVPSNWGKLVDTALRGTGENYFLSSTDLGGIVGQYIIITNPAARTHYLLSEIAINATAVPEPIPEPATISLLTLAGLTLLRRRK